MKREMSRNEKRLTITMDSAYCSSMEQSICALLSPQQRPHPTDQDNPLCTTGPGCFRYPFSRDIRVFQFRFLTFPLCRHPLAMMWLVAFADAFGTMLACNMRRGRALADNAEILAMFRLQYSGGGATYTLADDVSWVLVSSLHEWSAGCRACKVQEEH